MDDTSDQSDTDSPRIDSPRIDADPASAADRAGPDQSGAPTSPPEPPTEPPFGPPPFGPPPYGPPPGPGWPGGPAWLPAPARRLRRSRTDRVGVGLCGGLGRYFGIDPVIFRVLFAVLALFGGSGIALYLIGWVLIPDEDAANAPIDGLVDELRRRHVPIGLAIAGGVFAAWLVLFSWWAPHALIPAVIVTVVVLVLLSRRGPNPALTDAPKMAYGPSPSQGWTPNQAWTPNQGWTPNQAWTPNPGWAMDQSWTPDQGWTPNQASATGTATLPPATEQMRGWWNESRERGRERRRRALPIKIATLIALVAMVASLALADAVHGIAFATYFWAAGGIVLAGLLIGAVTRRTPWLVAIFLPPVLIGLLVFGSSRASLHDGVGERSLSTSNAADLHAQYKQFAGRETIDLSDVKEIGSSRTVRVRMGAGQVRLILPRTLPVRVNANIHLGASSNVGIQVEGGVNYTTSYATPAVATSGGNLLTIDVSVTAGQLEITYV